MYSEVSSTLSCKFQAKGVELPGLSVGDWETESVAKEQKLVEEVICFDLSSSLSDSAWLQKKCLRYISHVPIIIAAEM